MNTQHETLWNTGTSKKDNDGPSQSVIPMQVAGNSMKPYLKSGQMVFIRPVRFPLVPGKCYTYKQNKTFLIHRLVTLEGEYAIFQGDSVKHPERIPVGDIFGELEGQGNTLSVIVVNYINRLFYSLLPLFSSNHVFLKTRCVCISKVTTIERWKYERTLRKTRNNFGILFR